MHLYMYWINGPSTVGGPCLYRHQRHLNAHDAMQCNTMPTNARNASVPAMNDFLCSENPTRAISIYDQTRV